MFTRGLDDLYDVAWAVNYRMFVGGYERQSMIYRSDILLTARSITNRLCHNWATRIITVFNK